MILTSAGSSWGHTKYMRKQVGKEAIKFGLENQKCRLKDKRKQSPNMVADGREGASSQEDFLYPPTASLLLPKEKDADLNAESQGYGCS